MGDSEINDRLGMHGLHLGSVKCKSMRQAWDHPMLEDLAWHMLHDNELNSVLRVMNAVDREKLQGLPVGYTAAPEVAELARCDVLGSGWDLHQLRAMMNNLWALDASCLQKKPRLAPPGCFENPPPCSERLVGLYPFHLRGVVRDGVSFLCLAGFPAYSLFEVYLAL